VARLSIIIPVWGSLKRLEDTLISVLENQPHESEIIVVLDKAYDDPYGLKDEICFVQATANAGLATSINLGIEASRAPIVHVLACGVQVKEGWTDAAMAHFADPWVAAVAPLVVEIKNPERVVSAGLTYQRGGRLRILGEGRPVAKVVNRRAAVLGPHTSAAFYRKSALEMAGRFPSIAGDGLAGLDVALRLAYIGFRTVLEPRCILYADPPDRLRGSALRRALQAERHFWRWAPGFGWLTSLPLHALTVAAEFLRTLPSPAALGQLAGRMLGTCYFASGRRHYQGLRRLREVARASIAPAGGRRGRVPAAKVAA